MPPNDFVTRGQALIASGQYQEAVKVCRLGLLGRPTQVDGRLILAQALLALRRYDEVLAEMRVAIELESGLAAGHALRGEALLRKGDLHAARETLLRARQLAPGDPGVAALVAETELALSTGGSRLPPDKDADPRTKHYPTHRGGAPAAGVPGSQSFTKPAAAPEASRGDASAKREPGVSPRRSAAFQIDRTGTVELDPEESGIEMIGEDDDLGDVIDPPTPLEEMLIDDDDVVSEIATRTESTVAGKAAARGSTPRPSGQRGATGPDLGALFPEDDGQSSGLDRLLGELSGPPGASIGSNGGPALPLRAQPTGSVPLVEPRPPGKDDMRTIRAGLGLDPDTRLVKPVPGRAQDDTGLVVTAAPGGAMRNDESSVIDAGARVDPRRGQPTRKVATEPGGGRTRSVRGRAALVLYGLLAAAVIGGGVWGGFEIRAMRLDRQVAAAKRTADEDARADTWRGWRNARDVLEGVVAAQDSASNRAALARARAVLAGEFGEDLEGARAAVDALGALATPDAEMARAEIALAGGDPAALSAAAAALAGEAPDSADAAYVNGRLALAGDRWDEAVAAFDRARELGGARPLYLIGLARAHAGRRAYPEARAAAELALSQNPDHPGAVIVRARILAAAGTAVSDPVAASAAATALEKVLAESERKVDEQAAGVSPLQASWAALALAELHVARGDPTAAKRALERARAAAPPDREFSVAAIHVLLAVGDIAGARTEADRAGKTWPTVPDVAIAIAEVALAQGDAVRALEALAPAGDLSDRPEALALRGLAHLQVGDVEKATADLDAALSQSPELEPALVARAELDLAGGNPRAAVSRLEKRYGEGSTPQLAVTYAAALRGVGERDRARTVLGTLTGGDAPRPIAGRAWLETARLERDGGDARAARAAYAKAIEMLPDTTGARLEAAVLLIDSGDAAGARESLDGMAADPKADGSVLVEAGRVHVLVGDLTGAKQLLDRAETTATAPRWQIARERGRLALRERSFPVAIEALERAASLEPTDGETRLLLIDAHLAREDAPAARKVLDDVIKRFAGLPEAQLATGRVRLYADALDEAREAFVKAKDQLERSHAAPRWIADATYWLARTTYYGGDPNRAHALAAQAVGLDPSLADAYMLLGEIDAEKSAWKLSARSFAKVTELDPRNADAFFGLGEGAVKSKQKKVARAALAEYLKLAPTGDLAADAKAMLTKL